MSINIDNIMNASFGEPSNEIRATYKKTVLIRQYETEVIEVESTVKLDEDISGAERMFVLALLQAQLEYTTYCNLLVKGQVTRKEYDTRKAEIETTIGLIANKAEEVTGKSMQKWIGKLE